jgi:hypothetical protein
MVTNAKNWKSKSKAGEYELELPSGNKCLVRAIKPEAFLSAGLIPDPLTQMVMAAVNAKKGLPPSKMKEIAQDPTKLASAVEMLDRILVYAVIEPSVEMPPVCVADRNGEPCGELYTGGEGVHIDRKKDGYHKFKEPERDEELLYADVVDLEDKQFIFQWCVGGTGDVESFREELKKSVGSV